MCMYMYRYIYIYECRYTGGWGGRAGFGGARRSLEAAQVWDRWTMRDAPNRSRWTFLQ